MGFGGSLSGVSGLVSVHADGQIRSLNCVTLTVGDLKGHGELKTCQEHDRQMIDCLHVAWFWMRLREDGR